MARVLDALYRAGAVWEEESEVDAPRNRHPIEFPDVDVGLLYRDPARLTDAVRLYARYPNASFLPRRARLRDGSMLSLADVLPSVAQRSVLLGLIRGNAMTPNAAYSERMRNINLYFGRLGAAMLDAETDRARLQIVRRASRVSIGRLLDERAQLPTVLDDLWLRIERCRTLLRRAAMPLWSCSTHQTFPDARRLAARAFIATATLPLDLRHRVLRFAVSRRRDVCVG